MKFGVVLFAWEPFSYHPRLYGEVAVKAEEAGYYAFMVTDHFMRPQAPDDYPPYRHSTMDAWSIVNYCAGMTSTIKLGTCVTPLPMRHPPILAKMIATTDVVSDGRVIVGVGAGYYEREFKAYGVNSWEDAPTRVSRTEEGLIVMKRMWTEDVVDFEGKFYNLKDVVLEPKPVQKPHPPIWFGSFKKRMLRLTARFADVWIPSRAMGADVHFIEDKRLFIASEASRMGREVEIGVMGVIVDKGMKDSLTWRGTYKQYPSISTIDRAAEAIEEYKAAGCEYMILAFLPVERYIPLMLQFQKEIAPSFT